MIAARPPRPARSALAALCCLLAAGAFAQNVAINATGAPADPSALLDISSLSKGLLIPRANTLPAPAALPEGLMMYRTGGAVAVRGFHVVDQGQWVRLQPGKNGWDIYGNWLSEGAYPNPDFLGTTDDRPLFFRTNNLHRMRMDGATGHLGVGYGAAATSPERLAINGPLSMYYLPSPGQRTSNTEAAGVFRYQPFHSQVGNTVYWYPHGQYEEMAMQFPSAINTTNNQTVLGTAKNWPLLHAGHWGNVDGRPMVPGSFVAGVVTQPSPGGWRAFENPYEEHRSSWTHHRDANCITNGMAQLPVGVSGVNSSTMPDVDEQRNISPWYMQSGQLNYRRQYLFRAHEVDLELAQVAGGPIGNGLCRGGEINQLSFYAYAGQNRNVTAGGGYGNITVRNAPAGLNELNGFDNTPHSSTADWGCATLTTWPTTTAAGWFTINLSTPFVWDGTSNVLVEIAVRSIVPSGIALRHTQVMDAGFNASYGGFNTFATVADMLPDAVPLSWSCNNTANLVTRMPDAWPPSVPNAFWGESHWRPLIRFHGEVAEPVPGGTTGTSNYIAYTGALILEDTVTAVTDIPWGRWRPGHPTGNNLWSYQGNGTISAQHGVYDDALQLNDHVLDRAFDGRVAPSDAALHGGDRLLSIAEMARFTRDHRHLPTMKGRADWEQEGSFALGDLANQLWATTETQALYVTELHEKLNVIELLATDRPITAAEHAAALRELAGMPAYTDAEKQRLIAALRNRLTPAPSR